MDAEARPSASVTQALKLGTKRQPVLAILGLLAHEERADAVRLHRRKDFAYRVRTELFGLDHPGIERQEFQSTHAPRRGCAWGRERHPPPEPPRHLLFPYGLIPR